MRHLYQRHLCQHDLKNPKGRGKAGQRWARGAGFPGNGRVHPLPLVLILCGSMGDRVAVGCSLSPCEDAGENQHPKESICPETHL